MWLTMKRVHYYWMNVRTPMPLHTAAQCSIVRICVIQNHDCDLGLFVVQILEKERCLTTITNYRSADKISALDFFASHHSKEVEDISP